MEKKHHKADGTPKQGSQARKQHLFRSLGFQTRGDMREDDLSNSTTDHNTPSSLYASVRKHPNQMGHLGDILALIGNSLPFNFSWEHIH